MTALWVLGILTAHFVGTLPMVGTVDTSVTAAALAVVVDEVPLRRPPAAVHHPVAVFRHFCCPSFFLLGCVLVTASTRLHPPLG